MPYQKRYKIMEVSADGLLKEPSRYYTGNVFLEYYDTEHGAIDAIIKEGYSGDLVILTAMTKVWE